MSNQTDIAELKTHAKYHTKMLEGIDKKLDTKASKRELNIHRGLLISIWGVLLSVFTWIKIKGV